MANKEHLAILKQGVEVWNKWRKENIGIIPDLSGANLRNAILREADLHKANLSRADFTEACLVETNLSHADLSEANLNRTDLSVAILTEANLTKAFLVETNLHATDLRAANLSEAEIAFAIFSDVDLSEAKKLETCRHFASSTIGIDTVYRSQGKISHIFLNGAGVPENFIEFMKSLIGKGFEFYSCFISYASKDQEFAERIYADLQARGVRCWFAPEDLKIGDKFRVRIDESIRIHDKLLLVLSKNSIGSSWVDKEVETAFEQERDRQATVLFPIRLDNAVMDSKLGWAADIKRARNIGDFTNWADNGSYQKAFDRLLRDLKVDSKEKE